MNLLDDDNSEYEISNKIIDEYLAKHDRHYNDFLKENFSFNEETLNETENDDKQHHHETQTTQSDSSPNQASTKPTFLTYFISDNYLRSFFDLNKNEINKLIESTDKNNLIECYMNFIEQINSIKQTHSDSFRSLFYFLISKIRSYKLILVAFMILLCLSFIFKFHQCAFLISIGAFFTLIIVYLLIFKLFETYFLKNWLQSVACYTKQTKSLMVYLKELELANLSVSRKYLIENRQTFDSYASDDRLNLAFRRRFFLKLRRHFYLLRNLNLRWSKTLTNETNVELNLICATPLNELAEVLKLDVDATILKQLSDSFSINCIKSISKLNRLLLSENFKLIFLIIFQSIVNDANFSQTLRNIFNIAQSLVQNIKSFNNILKDLNDFEKLLKLTASNSEDQINKPVTRNNTSDISIYLRNALLLSYNLSSTNESIADLSLLEQLKSNFEICEFHLNNMLKRFKKNDVEKIQQLDEVKQLNKPQIENVTYQERQLSPEQIEDEIYEADLEKFDQHESAATKLSSNLQHENNSESDFKENLTQKNVFYELKYALKFKSNEWREREKNVKKRRNQTDSLKVTDEPQSAPDCSASFDDQIVNDHLLENDTLKYKSQLRKRKIASKNNNTYSNELNTDFTKPINRKYVYEEYDDDTKSTNKSIPKVNVIQQSTFFEELMNKRNLLIEKNNHINTIDEQCEEILCDSFI